MPIAAAALVQFAMIALALLLVLACATGALVMLRPSLLERLQRVGDARAAARTLNTEYNIDSWFYRRNRLYGAAVGLLAIVLLGYLTFGDASYRWLNAVEPSYRDVAAIVADSARIVLWLFGTFALIIATVVFTRPSALKGLESVVNRWISPPRSFRGLGRELQGPDRWVARHPRAWGALIAIGSAMCLLALVLHAGSLARMAI